MCAWAKYLYGTPPVFYMRARHKNKHFVPGEPNVNIHSCSDREFTLENVSILETASMSQSASNFLYSMIWFTELGHRWPELHDGYKAK